jgi:hypothetical protein
METPFDDMVAKRKAKRALDLKNWKANNPEKTRSYWNSEKGRATRDRYYHSEAGAAVRLKSYVKNREKIDARNAITRMTDVYKKKQRAYVDLYYTDPLKRVHHAVCIAKVRAKNAGFDYDPAIKAEVESNIPSHCPCCGCEIEYIHTKRGPSNPSLDRVDNSKGYVLGNCFITCWRCNSLKRHGTIQDFENILAYMRARIPAGNPALQHAIV